MLRFAEPFEDMERVIKQINGGWRGGVMPMDAFEQDGAYTLRFDLPGIDPDQVDVTVENNQLTVTVERSQESTDGVNWLVRERPTGTHSRQIHLGGRVDTSQVEASYDDGVLTVTIPLRAEAQPRKVSIGSSGGSRAIETTSTS